jgi:hypothetical protein
MKGNKMKKNVYMYTSDDTKHCVGTYDVETGLFDTNPSIPLRVKYDDDVVSTGKIPTTVGYAAYDNETEDFRLYLYNDDSLFCTVEGEVE